MRSHDEGPKIDESTAEIDGKTSSSSVLWYELPDDLWKEIFVSVDRGNLYGGLQYVSLVCKRFLALSNSTRTSFFICQKYKTVPMMSLLSRFTLIRRITFWGPDNLNTTITQLANSNLPLQSLRLLNQIRLPSKGMRLLGSNMKKTLRSLSCTDFQVMCDQDLALVADCFPYLREFDIEGSIVTEKNRNKKVTDIGIWVIVTKLKSLVSLNILYQDRLSHRSVEYLASNSSSLCNLSLDFYSYNCRTCVNSFLSFHCLTSLKLSGKKISKSVLVQISRTSLKLEKLGLEYYEITDDIDAEFFCGFLKSFRFLRCLKLGFIFPFPSDMKAKDFAVSIPNIKEIELLSCPWSHSPIPSGSLFHLLNSCPLLEDIAIACDYLHVHVQDLLNMPTHRNMHHLSFNICKDLSDEALMLIVSVCPKLKSLVITSCSSFTKEGIEAVITKCDNLKHVTVRSCRNVPDMEVIKNGW